MFSNLSKIKPKFRTSGRVSGNFGRNKVKAGSSMKGIGETNAKVLKMTTQEEYLQRLRDAYGTTTNPRMREFIYLEIRKIMVQRGQWVKWFIPTQNLNRLIINSRIWLIENVNFMKWTWWLTPSILICLSMKSCHWWRRLFSMTLLLEYIVIMLDKKQAWYYYQTIINYFIRLSL